MNAVTMFSPVIPQAQAQVAGQSVNTLRGCFVNSPFTAKIAFNPTNIRQSASTSALPVGKFTQIGQTIRLSGITTGSTVADAWDGKPDNMWYRLADGPGFVASAVVSGYPTRSSNCIVDKGGLPTTVGAANAFFKLQFKHSVYNPEGPPSSNNCGPASLAMILAALGKQPSGLNIQQSIDRVNGFMKRASTSTSTWEELQRGVTKAGGTPINISSWAELDQRLAKGQPVILNGRYNTAWRSQFAGYPGSTGNGDVPHLNAALGKTSDGKYIIGDPMHRGGAVAMTKSQLSTFFTLVQKNGDRQNGNPWGIAVTGL